jgi:glycerate 2-kinase
VTGDHDGGDADGGLVGNRDTISRSPAHDLALDCAAAGIAAAHPRRVVHESVTLDGDSLRVGDATYDLAGREVVVLGGGKAAGELAAALEDVVGDRLRGGAVVTDEPVETDRVDVLPGDHPVPSETGVESTRELLAAADAAGRDVLVLAMVAGGGSALLAAPAGVSLADLRATTEALLESGAPIADVNAVRKHLSAVKGGRLARRAAPAEVVSLVVSDVVGNDLDVIASGPTVPDSSTFADATDALGRHGVAVPDAVAERLAAGAAGDHEETPGPTDPAVADANVHVLADGFTALAAARDVAPARGFETVVLSSRIRGEAREAALTQAAVAEECHASGNPVEPPAVVLSGGETTVTVRGNGEGGPNQEFALRAAVEFADETAAVLAALDTDGRDGATDAAGALVDADTVEDASAALDALADNDASRYLDDRDALVETGPTGTNVNDLRVLVVT